MHVILVGTAPCLAPRASKCVLHHLVQAGVMDLEFVNFAILGFPYPLWI